MLKNLVKIKGYKTPKEILEKELKLVTQYQQKTKTCCFFKTLNSGCMKL